MGSEDPSSAAPGPDGYPLKAGHVPLPADEMPEALTIAATLRSVLREPLQE